MSFIGIGSPIPEIANLPGQGGAIEVLLDYSSAAVCNNDSTLTPTQAEPSGGVFSASPSGLNINTSTGVITPTGSTHGTYTITYTVSGESSSFTFTINPLQQSTFSYSSSSLEQYGTASPIFASGTTTGGTFSATSGLVINTTTGVLDLASSTIGGPYTVTYTTPGPCATSSTFNVSVTALSTSLVDNNFALSFDASSSQYVTLPEINLGSQQTISFWINRVANGVASAFLGGSNGWGSTGIAIYVETNNVLYMSVNGLLYENFGNVFGTRPAGNWYHICLSRDGDSVTLYVDGVSVSTKTGFGTGDFKIDTIGAAKHASTGAYNYEFDGDMDEVALWNRALDATDIQRIYNGSSTSGKAANLFSTGLSNGLVYWNRMGD